MVKHISWTDIESFHNVRKTTAKYPHVLRDKSTVTYRAKVKLHGTNAGIVIEANGTVTALSRSSVITSESDNAGFARWVADKASEWKKFAPKSGIIVIFGEWCGPGIQKGVAVNQLTEKIFAMFGARFMSAEGVDEHFVDDPYTLNVFSSKGCYVIPWFNSGEEFKVDWNAASEDLEPVLARITAHVEHVEECDPWICAKFGIRGIGEGLVFYPVDDDHKGYETFGNLCFKAKGERHRVVAKTKSVQVDPAKFQSLRDFAEAVCTAARLEQGVRAVSDGELKFDTKSIGPFLAWISRDVIKETQDEMTASGLEEKAAVRACCDRARNWYVAEMKKL